MERCKNPGSQNKFSWDTSNFSVAFSPKAQSASSCISFMVYTVNQQLWWLMTWSFYKWMISNILFIKIVNLFFSTCSFVVICYTATGDQNVRQGYCEGVVLWLLIWVQLGEKYETIHSIGVIALYFSFLTYHINVNSLWKLYPEQIMQLFKNLAKFSINIYLFCLFSFSSVLFFLPVFFLIRKGNYFSEFPLFSVYEV